MEKSIKKPSSISAINKAEKWHIKPPVFTAGYYLHLSLRRLGRVSDHYVSLIFPTSKSTQPFHALLPENLLLLLFTKMPKSNNSVTLQHFPSPKYFGSCSYLQTCRTALPMIVHSLHPQDFLWSSFFSRSIFLFLQQGKYGK